MGQDVYGSGTHDILIMVAVVPLWGGDKGLDQNRMME